MTIRGIKIPVFMSLIIWAIVWEFIGRTDASFVIPPLSNVAQRIIEIAPTDTFINALAITGKSYFLGMGISILFGVPLGIVMGRSDVVDKLFLPWVNIFVSAPLTALVPVIMVLFGFGEQTIVLTVVLFAIWIIVLNARAGVREISRSLVEMAHCFGATPLQSFFKIYIWAALPEILGGIRLGFIRGVKGVIIGQLLVSIIGFGQLFELYSSRFLMEHFWAQNFMILAFVFTLNEGLVWLQNKVSYYASTRD